MGIEYEANLTPESYTHVITADELFGVCYTSGTTGLPKGVTFTQGQLKEAALGMAQTIRSIIHDGPSHTYIAYLPQAHVLELCIELFLFLGGVKVGYATPFTLNESAPGLAEGVKCDLQLLKPTVMTTVPLVLDRMQKEIYAKLEKRTPFSKALFDCLMEYKILWTGRGYGTPIVDRLLCSKVQQQFGNRLSYMVVGSAPLAENLQSLIKNSLNVKLLQGYGTTETLGGVIAMDFADLSYGRVGSPMNGVTVRLYNWEEGNYRVTDKPHARGEIVVGGKMLSSGYYKQDELSKQTFFTENGTRFFITGDIGELFADGTLKIIDRKKDLVKLANGEYFSLGKVSELHLLWS